MTSDSGSVGTIEEQYSRIEKTKNVFDFMTKGTYSNFILKYTNSVCSDGQYRNLMKRGTLHACGEKCSKTLGCIYFAWNTENHECFSVGTKCNQRQKNLAVTVDIYLLVGTESGSFLWYNHFAKCTETAQTLPEERINLVHDAKTCAANCLMSHGSMYFYFDKTRRNLNNKNDQCRCLSENSSCTLTPQHTCCPGHAPCENSDFQRQNCAQQKKPLWSIGYILETVEKRRTTMRCPEVNYFITTNKPLLSRMAIESVQDCMKHCRTFEKCSFTAIDVKNKLCYLLQGGITSVKEEIGWVVGNKQCSKMMEQHPDSLFWSKYSTL